MNIVMFAIGLGIIGAGVAIWRYQWIHLLSNVRAEEVDPSRKGALARYAGRFTMLFGGIVLTLAYLTEQALTEKSLLNVVTGFVVVAFMLMGIYLRGLRQFMKK